MGKRGPEFEGSISDIPWAAAFDPSINVHALGEIQARGLRAASEIVDKFVRLGKRHASGYEQTAHPTESRQPESSTGPTIPDVDQVLGAWQKMFGQMTTRVRGIATPFDGAATFDLNNARTNGHIALETMAPGPASTEVWLHNGGPDDLGKVRLRCSDLLAHDGAVIPSDHVRFEPDVVPMVARCSRGVTMAVDVLSETAPGCYRGTLLADGHPEVWLSVALTVLSPAS